MNAATAATYLPCHRRGARSCGVVEKALHAIERDSEQKRLLREQEDFDDSIVAELQALQLPADFRARLSAAGAAGECGAPRVRPPFKWTVVGAVACGVISILGLLAAAEMDRRSHFVGRETAERMLDGAIPAAGAELEPVSKRVGQLGDWFYIQGFEGYVSPEEFQPLPAVGARVLHLDGKPVAEVAIDQHDCILYTFRASDFGIDLPQKAGWLTFDHEGWAAALRRRGDLCSMVTFRGAQSEMKSFLKSFP